MSRSWWSLLRRQALVLLGAAWVGWLVGHSLAALLLATLGCLAWQMWKLRQLDRWLREGRDGGPVPFEGLVWA
ncbi:MAG: phosphate regulon sensor protein PhoR, partial [Candidatus Competibacter sp.]